MKRSTIFIETVNKMNEAAAVEYLDTMVRLEAARSGSKELAITKICRDYGLTPAQIKHVRGGRAKDIKLSLFQRVRLAYLDYMHRLITSLEHEVAVEKAKHEDDSIQVLESEVQALLQKVEEARSRYAGKG